MEKVSNGRFFYATKHMSLYTVITIDPFCPKLVSNQGVFRKIEVRILEIFL